MQQAIERYIEIMCEIRQQVQHIESLADNHFGVIPDEVNWGHVGDVARIRDILKEITEWVG